MAAYETRVYLPLEMEPFSIRRFKIPGLAGVCIHPIIGTKSGSLKDLDVGSDKPQSQR
jgi:hypothetical protein